MGSVRSHAQLHPAMRTLWDKFTMQCEGEVATLEENEGNVHALADVMQHVSLSSSNSDADDDRCFDLERRCRKRL